MMTADLVAMSDAGYHEMTREITVRSGGEVLERDGLLMVASADHPAPFIVNETIRLDQRVPAAETIARAREYAARRDRTAGICTRPRDADLVEALQKGGWELVVELPGMVAIDPIEPADPGAGVELRAITTEEDLRTLVAVLGESFGPEEPWPSLWASIFKDLSTVARSDTPAVIAYADGQAAAAAVAYALEPVGIVGMVGAISSYGGRGLGNLVTRQVAAAAQQFNGRPVVLQSSPMARPLYERIGFQAVTTYRIWEDSRPS